MARIRQPHIELDGPLFDPKVVRLFNDAVAEGIEEAADQGVGIYMGFVQKRGFVATGTFIRKVESKVRRQHKETPGYATVGVDSTQPPVTWGERGTRRGVRLRTGGWFARNTATRLKTLDYEEMIGSRIEKAIG